MAFKDSFRVEPAPETEGEKEFRRIEAAAREGMPERAADAQKRAAEAARKKREDEGKIDVTKDFEETAGEE